MIGITSCRKLEDYKQAILHVGGEVRVLDHAEAQEALGDRLDGVTGLLLTGGEDVAPARYGEAAHPTVVDVSLERDAFETDLVAAAQARNLPILAICRGIQVLNVARGGTLIQDIPAQSPGALPHNLKVPAYDSFHLAHEIWVEKDSMLSAILGERLVGDACEVNSRHHQAVKTVAPSLRVTATAPDGVIEAIEDRAARFCIGVQWHPENFWRTGEFRALFEAFLEAAAQFPHP